MLCTPTVEPILSVLCVVTNIKRRHCATVGVPFQLKPVFQPESANTMLPEAGNFDKGLNAYNFVCNS